MPNDYRLLPIWDTEMDRQMQRSGASIDKTELLDKLESECWKQMDKLHKLQTLATELFQLSIDAEPYAMQEPTHVSRGGFRDRGHRNLFYRYSQLIRDKKHEIKQAIHFMERVDADIA
jgi:hypothetical protein